MPRGYGEDLAYVHDAGFGAWPRAAATVLIGELRRRGLEGRVVDLACGSGIVSAKLIEAGLDAYGVDLSPSMIDLARRRVPNGRFHHGSLWTAPLPQCVAVAAVGEVFNFLFVPGDPRQRLAGLLRRIYGALVPGGVLLFDIAMPGRVPGGKSRGFFEGDDWAVGVAAEEKEGVLTRHITSFRRLGAHYRCSREVHRLQLLERRAVAGWVRQAGFHCRIRRGYGDLTLPGMAIFLARKPIRSLPARRQAVR